MTSRRALLAAGASFAFAAPGFAADGPPQIIGGTFPEGTRWTLIRPAAWNGALMVDLDGARPAAVAPAGAAPSASAGVGQTLNAFQAWLLANGYAFGGTTREPVGYRFDKAVENLVEVRRLFIAKWGRPRRTLVSGVSRGAFVARKAMELRPDIFEGALVSAGGGGGLIAGLHDRLNATFVLKILVDPDAPLKLVNITDTGAEQATLTRLLETAMASRQGRARIALAAAFEQFSPWTARGKPKPGPTDYEAQLEQIAESFVFANPAVVRAGVEKVAGGNVSWNTGVDYADRLRRSGRQRMVEALYRKAGADLAADLATLARAPRISADPAHVARAEKVVTYTGRIKGPVVNVDNDDPVDAASYKLAYLETLKKAGTDGLFRLLWNDTAGHATQAPIDRAVGFSLLVGRLDTGRWGDTSLPATRALAAEIAARSPVDLGKPTLFDPGAVPRPLFTWDASNWGRYRA